MSDFPARFEAAIDSGITLVETAAVTDATMAFARSVAAGLSADPKWLHPQYLYDAEGSQLFKRITEQREYYPTRTEAAILAGHSAKIAEITGPVTLVELGSGFSVKTEHLLNAYVDGGDELHYIPVDVSETALREASRAIGERFPTVRVTGISGPYRSAFPIFRRLSPQMVIFLGSTLGNFNEAEMTAFWSSVHGHLPGGDYFLLGIDLVKERAILEAAYNDAAGYTAMFTRNVWARVNRELGAEIDLDEIEHVAAWNDDYSRMDIFTRFNTRQQVFVAPLGQTFEISPGEQVLIEISRKFRLPEVTSELALHGFDVLRTFTDPSEWFALLLLQRIDDAVIRPLNPSQV